MTTKATAVNLIIVSDPGKDLDDENTLILAGALTDLDLVNLKAVIAVLAPSDKRAMLAKGTLNKIGLSVPVGIGGNCTVIDSGQSDHEFEAIDYLAQRNELEEGHSLLFNTLNAADDKSIVWLLIAGLTDPAQVLRDHEELFCRKTSRVVIMGGVRQENNTICLDTKGHMVPDTAANNAFDEVSAQFLYGRLQELSIPLTILTREAAYAAQVPRDHYDEIAATNNPVGIKLKNTQQRLIEALWKRANYAADDPRRKSEKMPPRCNREWFCDTFCAGEGKNRTGEDSIWDLIRGFNLYDPMALLAAVPGLSTCYFSPETLQIGGATHEIIGVSKAKTGVKDGPGIVAFLTEKILAGLQRN